jgi:hypothetical protein
MMPVLMIIVMNIMDVLLPLFGAMTTINAPRIGVIIKKDAKLVRFLVMIAMPAQMIAVILILDALMLIFHMIVMMTICVHMIGVILVTDVITKM